MLSLPSDLLIEPPFGVTDSLVICRFIAERTFGTQVSDSLRDVMNYVTGWEMNLEEVEAIGERIYTLERIINVKRGSNRSHDTLPYRVMNEPIPEGPVEGRYCPPEALQTMLNAYYQLRGWDADSRRVYHLWSDTANTCTIC